MGRIKSVNILLVIQTKGGICWRLAAIISHPPEISQSLEPLYLNLGCLYNYPNAKCMFLDSLYEKIVILLK